MFRNSLDDNIFDIVPNDDEYLEIRPDAIWVGTVGDLVIETSQGTVVVFENAVGWMPVRPRKVLTGTTATGLVGVVNQLARD